MQKSMSTYKPVKSLATIGFELTQICREEDHLKCKINDLRRELNKLAKLRSKKQEEWNSKLAAIVALQKSRSKADK